MLAVNEQMWRRGKERDRTKEGERVKSESPILLERKE